jgi:structure-specific recognition protein 1
MSEEDIAKYDKLKKNYEEPTYEVVSSVSEHWLVRKLSVQGASKGLSTLI